MARWIEIDDCGDEYEIVDAEDYDALVAERDGFRAAWQNACERGDKAVARLAEAEQAIESAGKCLAMSNNGAREAFAILQAYKRNAVSAVDRESGSKK